MNVKNLNLSTRTLNALTRHGIDDTHTLTNMSRSELAKLRRFGPSMLDDVEQSLYDVGLHLQGSNYNGENALNKYTVTEFDKIRSQMNGLNARLQYLEEHGKGLERYAKQGFIDKNTKTFKQCGRYQKQYWNEMIKMTKGLFLDLSSPTAEWQRTNVQKQTNFRIEQAEMACEYLNKMIDLWNEYSKKAHDLDLSLLGVEK